MSILLPSSIVKFFNWRIINLIIWFGLGLWLSVWLLVTAPKLFFNATQPVDAIFVLGGSIQREMFVTQLAKQDPQIPILISSGSQDPCIWIIFDREKAPKENVWLEHCADSTFDNFFYGLPILRQWGVRKVKLVTSTTHLPRAQWLAQIHFAARGIWVIADILDEEGVPGNQESTLKTTVDVARSLLWTLFSGWIQPECDKVVKLVDVDMEAWRKSGFKCEHQAGIN